MILRRRKIMSETIAIISSSILVFLKFSFVILIWFAIFYLARKLYYENKMKTMKKKWNSWLPLPSKT